MEISLSLCGDVLISKRLPHLYGEDISDLFLKHDCRFGNLETTIHRREGYPAAFPGGGYAMADPRCLKDLKDFGFNLFSTANNHAMDYSCNGLLATMKYLQEYDISFSGTGVNLSDASKPAYVECTGGRVALISVTSSFHDSYAAGPQNQEIQGRPGVAPLRHTAIYDLDEKNYEDLCRIAKESGINAYHDMGIRTGYLTAVSNLRFGPYQFRKGERNEVHTTPNKEDLQRTINVVKDTKGHSDVVIVSIHTHQMLGSDESRNPEFVSLFAKECVDAGANIVVCHGSHRLRGIEVYKDGIIFHGLGNFIFQHELVDFCPEELYNRYGLTRQSSTGSGELFRVRSKNGTIGAKTMPDCYRSVIASVKYKDGSMETSLVPVEIDVQSGLPKITKDMSILEKLEQLSETYHTKIILDKDKTKAYIYAN